MAHYEKAAGQAVVHIDENNFAALHDDSCWSRVYVTKWYFDGLKNYNFDDCYVQGTVVDDYLLARRTALPCKMMDFLVAVHRFCFYCPRHHLKFSFAPSKLSFPDLHDKQRC